MKAMTNEQKYRTAEERIKAFNAWCLRTTCDKCDKPKNMSCGIYWLALPCEDKKPEPCQFCGGETRPRRLVGGFCVECDCGYTSPFAETEAVAVAAHNRMVRAVRAAKESGAKQ